MLPLDLPTEKKRFVSFIRTISLTKPGVSTNQIFEALSQTVYGLDCCDTERENVQVLIDIWGLLTKYPASWNVLDAMERIARVPCTHCSCSHGVEERKPKVLPYNYKQLFELQLHQKIQEMLEHRFSGMTSSDAEVFGMKKVTFI